MLWQARQQNRRKSRGTAIVEFVLAATFIYTPLILGTMLVGVNIIRAIQVTQVNRDAGHMFARGVDFSATVNQSMLAYVASGLNLTSDGKSVVNLSAILKVGPKECPTGCANLGKTVFTRQIRLGNTALRASAYGTPAVNGSGAVVNYLTSSAAVTTTFDPAVMTLSDGEIAYVAETYYSSSELDLPGFMTGTGVFARGIF